MQDPANFEIVQLADGRFTVRTIGAVNADLDDDVFATREEAERGLFMKTQDAGEPGVITPGFGEGPL